MKRLSVFLLLITGLALLFIAVNCSSGSDTPISPEPGGPDHSASGGTIILGDPVISGDEISVPVEFTDFNDIYAMSFRVGFNPAALDPVRVDWTPAITEEDSTFSLVDRTDFVPLAIARFNGGLGFYGDGTLCVITFRSIDPDSRPWIINNDEYLVARDSSGSDLALIAGGDVR